MNSVSCVSLGEKNAMASVMTGTAIVAPPVTNGLFALAISAGAPVSVPGAPFFLGSLLCLAALWLASRQFSSARQSPVTPALANAN